MAQHFDVSVKLLIQTSRGVMVAAIFGGPVRAWLNVELPKVQNPRVDLLARAADGSLRHLELETDNARDTPRRVAEYYLGLYRLLNRHVEMVVLYLGKRPLRMKPVFVTPSMNFEFRLIDIRSFDGEPLLESNDLGDNMLALLTRCDQERVLRRVEERLRQLPPGKKEAAARTFVIISGLRGIEKEVSRRLQMIDIMENKVLGPAIRQGMHKGLQKGLSAQLRERFGPLPAWATKKLDEASERQLLAWGKRVLTAKTLNAVFQQ